MAEVREVVSNAIQTGLEEQVDKVGEYVAGNGVGVGDVVEEIVKKA